MNKTAVIAALALMLTAADAEQITILGINDMHANMRDMPKLDTFVKEQRKLDPQLLLLSAGDNRTGDPYCDSHPRSGWPMTVLMNKVGFDLSTLGNHEFDGTPDSLRDVINSAEFRHVCANLYAPDSLRLHVEPYRIFERKGVKIGVLGLIQVNKGGIPDVHPKKVKGLSFGDPFAVAHQYRWLRQHCDVLILLTHLGYEDDLKLAEMFPEADAIVGGHSHTRVEHPVPVNGVLVTQNEKSVRYITKLTFDVENGKVQDKKAELFSLKEVQPDAECAALVEELMSAPELRRPLAENVSFIPNRSVLAHLISDAVKDGTGADFALQNPGGVRSDTLPIGTVTVADVFRMDPFRNDVVLVKLTGRELIGFLEAVASLDHEYGVPSVSGLRYEGRMTPDFTVRIDKAELPDGTPLDLDQIYTVAVNSFAFSAVKFPHADPGESTGQVSEELIMDYLERCGQVDYGSIHPDAITPVDSF